jgi:beta-lactamase superfamily II metal-dependent hydrolase
LFFPAGYRSQSDERENQREKSWKWSGAQIECIYTETGDERSRRSKVITAAHQPAQMTVEFTGGLYTYNIKNKIFEK